MYTYIYIYSLFETQREPSIKSCPFHKPGLGIPTSSTPYLTTDYNTWLLDNPISGSTVDESAMGLRGAKGSQERGFEHQST